MIIDIIILISILISCTANEFSITVVNKNNHEIEENYNGDFTINAAQNHLDIFFINKNVIKDCLKYRGRPFHDVIDNIYFFDNDLYKKYGKTPINLQIKIENVDVNRTNMFNVAYQECFINNLTTTSTKKIKIDSKTSSKHLFSTGSAIDIGVDLSLKYELVSFKGEVKFSGKYKIESHKTKENFSESVISNESIFEIKPYGTVLATQDSIETIIESNLHFSLKLGGQVFITLESLPPLPYPQHYYYMIPISEIIDNCNKKSLTYYKRFDILLQSTLKKEYSTVLKDCTLFPENCKKNHCGNN